MGNRELVVKVVNTNDMTRVLYLRDQAKPVKHVSFDPNGTLLSVTSHDGQIYVYSLSSEQPELVKRLEGLAANYEPDAEASSRAVWHPDGRAFAISTPTKGSCAPVDSVSPATETLTRSRHPDHIQR